jgi:glycosyltransferase involved in cell wall biosynthesis
MPQMDARKRLGMPADAFIIGIVAANKGYPPRKSWPEMFEAFAKLRTKHNDAILFAHTNPTTQHGGVNLFEIAEQNGLRLGTDVFFPNQYQLVMGGLNDDGMSDLYSAMDVHLLASRGEGFGIPIVEAQACGCPVIVGDWTSMPELVFAGWKIPMSDARPEWSPLGGYQFAPRVGAIVDALEAAYTVRGNDEYRKRARAGAVKYDADVVFERYWLPVLAEITEGLPK